jgi:hypothetical protein
MKTFTIAPSWTGRDVVAPRYAAPRALILIQRIIQSDQYTQALGASSSLTSDRKNNTATFETKSRRLRVTLARAMITFMASFLGHIRGVLSSVMTGGMFLVSGISGSKAVEMAAVAPMLLPEKKRRGSKPGGGSRDSCRRPARSRC